MTLIKDIVKELENFAPPSLQESYDNSGLLIGNCNKAVKKTLLCLDCTEEVVEEAIREKCEFIVAHHPIIFGGLKSLTGKNHIERTVIKAIKNDIAIYACHTNLDHVKLGVNNKIADKLGLINRQILAPNNQSILKLECYCPQTHTQELLQALADAGAGKIGDYSECSFTSTGIGNFKGNKNSNPTVGKALQKESAAEEKIEVLLPHYLQENILLALKKAHPYEEIAYFLHQTLNTNQDLGSGMTGELEQEMEVYDFFDLIKEKLEAKVIKHTHIHQPKIKRIALCGGSGSFLLKHALQANADLYLSSDFKYHEFFDAENKLIIADIGHYETESCTKELFFDILKEKFANIALVFSKTYTNPVKYY